MIMNPQTNPPSQEPEPLLKLRRTSLPQSLRRANLAAWLMPDAGALYDDDDENEAPQSARDSASEAASQEAGKKRGKPTTRRRWLGVFS